MIPCKDMRQLNSHAKLGPNCLQLAGGAPRTRLVVRKYNKSTISRPVTVSQMDVVREYPNIIEHMDAHCCLLGAEVGATRCGKHRTS